MTEVTQLKKFSHEKTDYDLPEQDGIGELPSL